MDDWTATLPQSGIASDPVPAQASPLQTSVSYAGDAIPASKLSGPLSPSVRVGNSSDPNSIIYIDVTNTDPAMQGIWAGNAQFVLANFSVDINGNLVANSATIKGSITSGSTITGSTIVGGSFQTGTTGQRIFIGTIPFGMTTAEAIVLYDQSGSVTGYLYGFNVSGSPTLSLADGLDPTTSSGFTTANGQASVVGNLGVVIQTNGAVGNQRYVAINGADGANVNMLSFTNQVLSGSGNITTNSRTVLFTGTSGGTITLPPANAIMGFPYELLIIDKGGHAGTNPITVAAHSGDQVSSGTGSLGASFNISISYASVLLSSDGQNAWY